MGPRYLAPVLTFGHERQYPYFLETVCALNHEGVNLFMLIMKRLLLSGSVAVSTFAEGYGC